MGLSTPTDYLWPREPSVLLTYRLPPMERLRQALPQSTDHLLDAASSAEALFVLQRPDGSLPAAATDMVRSLGQDLLTVAHETAQAHDSAIGQALAAQADALIHWHPPDPLPRHAPALHHSAPWILCGPVRSWGSPAKEPLLSLIVALPDAERSQTLGDADTRVRRLAEYYEQALGAGQVTLSHTPAYLAADLILEVGSIAAGHHHFAHFLPDITGLANGPHNDYTLVFSNILEARFRLISAPLFERLTGRSVGCHPEDRADWLNAWFRGHDLGHFWAPAWGLPAGLLSDSRFLALALDEAKADVLGACAAAGPWGDAAGVDCYIAELLRYARRDPFRFADSMAAALELQMFADAGAIRWPSDDRMIVSAPTVNDTLRELGSRLIDPADKVNDPLRASAVAVSTKWSARLGEVCAVDDLLYERGAG